MKKKELLVIILAFVLALVFTSFIMRGNKTSTVDKVEINNENQIEVEVENFTQEEIKEEKVDETMPVNVSKNPVVIDRIEVKNDIVEEISETEMQPEKESNVVVITREFKVESPAKYSFKGYGVLDRSSN